MGRFVLATYWGRYILAKGNAACTIHSNDATEHHFWLYCVFQLNKGLDGHDTMCCSLAVQGGGNRNALNQLTLLKSHCYYLHNSNIAVRFNYTKLI